MKQIKSEEYTKLDSLFYNSYQNYLEASKDMNEIMSGKIKPDELNRLLAKVTGISRTFGDYLKRFYWEKKYNRTISFDSIDDSDFRKWIIDNFLMRGMRAVEIKKIPAVANRSVTKYKSWNDDKLFKSGSAMGSMNFFSTTKMTDSYLQRLLSKDSGTTERDTLFLFAFGLGMSVDEVSYFLQHVLKTSDFNYRDWKEAVYYWCILNSEKKDYRGIYKGIAGVFEAEKKYYSFSEKNANDVVENYDTLWYGDKLDGFAEDKEFEEFLVASKPLENSISRLRVFERHMLEIYQNQTLGGDEMEIVRENIRNSLFDAEKLGMTTTRERELQVLDNKLNKINIDDFLKQLYRLIDTDFVIPFDDEIIKRISFPNMWNEDNLGLKLKRNEAITRKDILTICFLKEQLYVESERTEEETFDSFQEVKEELENISSFELLECNMEPKINLSDSYELFLSICMLYKKPYSLFMKCWQLNNMAKSKKGKSDKN